MVEPAHAAVYECRVTHARRVPLRHAFTYHVFMLDVDIDALEATAAQSLGLSHNRFNLFSIYDRDHVDLGIPGGIRPNLAAWLRQRGFVLPGDARVRLLTFPRVLGYGFNPVSFYFLTSATGTPLAAVAEVTNTYREMKLYLVDGAAADAWRTTQPKDFYVSPFSDPGDTFDFHLGLPGAAWTVRINTLRDAEVRLASSMLGTRRPLSRLLLPWLALKYPLLSIKIITLIHWHALRLWLRKVPFFRKRQRRDAQRDVLRPHSSLTNPQP